MLAILGTILHLLPSSPEDSFPAPNPQLFWAHPRQHPGVYSSVATIHLPEELCCSEFVLSILHFHVEEVPLLRDNCLCLILCLTRDVAFTIFLLSSVPLHKQNTILFMFSAPTSIWVFMVWSCGEQI